MIEPIGINEECLHIWRVEVIVKPFLEECGRKVLSTQEVAILNRFRFSVDRGRYLVAHYALRLILARYLSIRPKELMFGMNRHGKPELAYPSPLRFNMTHSGDIVLIAVTMGKEVGVDVEQHRAGIRHLEIAERFFAPQEIAALRGLDEVSIVRSFFDCWVRKEAYVKAIGEGLSCPLNCFNVPVSSPLGNDVILYDLSHHPWQLREISIGSGYSAAVVTRDGVADTMIEDWKMEDSTCE